MNIAEIFTSIQGEGRYLGHPSIFIRTSGCNLRCQWGATRCDTPYTSWEPEAHEWSVAAVLAEVRRQRAVCRGLDHLVLTGGEPLLQAELPELARALQAEGFFITLETNGTIAGTPAVDFVSLSPKLASSTPADDPRWRVAHERARLRPSTLRQWLDNYDCQLKFVVDAAADEEEILALLAAVGGVTPERVFLMPQGIAAGQLQQHAQLCLGMCLRHGWRYTPRAHIEIFGNQRGV